MLSDSDKAIVVPSCDKYNDLWKPFFLFFNKYWPDSRLPVYLFSNTLDYKQADVAVIKTGPPSNWFCRIKKRITTGSRKLCDDYS